MHKEQLRGDKTELPPWDGQQRNYWGGGGGGGQLVCGRPILALSRLDWKKMHHQTGEWV